MTSNMRINGYEPERMVNNGMNGPINDADDFKHTQKLVNAASHLAMADEKPEEKHRNPILRFAVTLVLIR